MGESLQQPERTPTDNQQHGRSGGENPEGGKELRAHQERLSVEAARAKLALLLGENFRNFAVRFMGIEEYRKIFETGVLEAREATIFGQEGRWRPSFKEYVQHAQERRFKWADVADDQTNWPFSVVDMTAYKYLLDELKKAHNEERENSNKREATLTKFRESVKDLIRRHIPMHYAVEDFREVKSLASAEFPNVNFDYVIREFDRLKTPEEKRDLFQRSFPHASDMLTLYWKNLHSILVESRADVCNVAIMDEFLNDETYLTRDKRNLRKLINAVAYAPKATRNDWQYHIALILDIEGAAVGGRTLHTEWGYIGGRKDWRGQSTYQKEDAILGAVATMPNKEMRQEMMALSSRAGAIAHPIFDAQGVVRWPRSERRP